MVIQTSTISKLSDLITTLNTILSEGMAFWFKTLAAVEALSLLRAGPATILELCLGWHKLKVICTLQHGFSAARARLQSARHIARKIIIFDQSVLARTHQKTGSKGRLFLGRRRVSQPSWLSSRKSWTQLKVIHKLSESFRSYHMWGLESASQQHWFG